MKKKDLNTEENLIDLIKGSTPKLNQEPEFLFHLNYYDGPFSGICKFENKYCYFDCVREYDRTRIYVIVELTHNEWLHQKYCHEMFEKYVGKHTNYRYKNGRNYREHHKESLASKEDQDYYFNVLRKKFETINHENKEIVAWWDAKNTNMHFNNKEKKYNLNYEKQKILLDIFKEELENKLYDHRNNKYSLRGASRSFHQKLTEKRTAGNIYCTFELGFKQEFYEAKLQNSKYKMRVMHVAYSLLKGNPYKIIEPKRKFNGNHFMNRFVKDVYNLYSKFAHENYKISILTQEQIKCMITEGEGHEKPLEK